MALDELGLVPWRLLFDISSLGSADLILDSSSSGIGDISKWILLERDSTLSVCFLFLASLSMAFTTLPAFCALVLVLRR